MWDYILKKALSEWYWSSVLKYKQQFENFFDGYSALGQKAASMLILQNSITTFNNTFDL